MELKIETTPETEPLPPGRRPFSIVIPAYNESRRIAKTILQVEAFLERRGYEAEIIVVDDGSVDGTSSCVNAIVPRPSNLRILAFPFNHGKGFAVKTGMLASRADPVLFTDADLSTPIEEVEKLWDWIDRGFDVVIGSRHSRDSGRLVRQPLHRKGIGRVFNLVVSMLALRGIRDTQCGFKLFSAKAARQLFPSLRCRGFSFDVELLIRAREIGLRIAEVPVKWTDMAGSHIHPVRDGARMVIELLRIRGIL